MSFTNLKSNNMEAKSNTISLDELDEFKDAYSEAIESEKITFFFKGQEIAVSYAKYVIEYLESKKND